MNNLEAKILVEKTFENPFEEKQFVFFIKNLLNDLDDSESKKFVYNGSLIPESFREAIKQFKRIGQYADDKKNVIDVLLVNIKRDITLERARTLQRNFIARHLKQRNHDAALVAFYTEGFDDWRFSLVKMEFNLTQQVSPARGDLEGAKIKIEVELSPAKRYSFLVGANERSHTAQSQFQKILTEIPNPSLSELEQAFNIEPVTKEFFDQYRNLFIRTKQELDKVLKSDAKLKTELDSKSVNSVDFSKKLLGQIIFLYFLQKKGWFGVERDSDWGTGSKKFLRELFEKKHGDYKYFFNDILEPLFYFALRIDRSHDDHYYDRFNCKIPFLNGGLFDPIGNYDWVHTDINLPNELFSNKNKTPQGDIGNGIFDIFDRYNFTVIEDEPLEKEVAIDPELLGKTYEKFNAIRPDNFDEYLNALKSGKKGEENKFNKQYGVYYTPREIVHYMCRESLINYLASEFNNETVAYQKLDTNQLDAFGNTERNGQLFLESTIISPPSGETKRGLPPKEDIETLINYGELISENEAVVETKGRETETYFYKMPESIRKNAKLIDEKLADILICDPAVGSGAFPVGMMHEIVSTRNILSIFIKDKTRTIYKFKRECIEKSLYGVDIDSGAVEIAKLRLWLSLVVDEDDFKEIKPLPNLDYKIVKGNSLLGFPEAWQSSISEIIETLKKEFFTETRPQLKAKLKEEIEEQIKSRLINSEKNFGYKIDFDFKTFFSEVFHSKSGFDVIIGNPPYISHDKIIKEQKNYLKNVFNSYEPFADLYCYFIEKGLYLQNFNGIICFITSNSFLRSEYGSPLRNLLLQKNNILQIINIEDSQLFESAIVNAVILISKNGGSKENLIKVVNNYYDTSISFNKFINTKHFMYENSFLHTKNWNLRETHLLKLFLKIRSSHKTLEEYNTKIRLGLATGDNNAFIVDEETKNIFLSKDRNNNSIIKPILRGRDINRYYYSFPNLYIILSKNGLNVKTDYPTIFSYFDSLGPSFKKRGAKGQHWSNLRACSFLDDFKLEKIIWIELTDKGRFTICDEEIYLLNTAYFLLPPSEFSSKFLLAILNSKTIQFYLESIAETSGMGVNRWINNFVKDFPIPSIEKSLQIKFEVTVGKVLIEKQQNPRADTQHLEDRIDTMVYKLYNLTYEEVKIIDSGIVKLISEKEYDKFSIV